MTTIDDNDAERQWKREHPFVCSLTPGDRGRIVEGVREHATSVVRALVEVLEAAGDDATADVLRDARDRIAPRPGRPVQTDDDGRIPLSEFVEQGQGNASSLQNVGDVLERARRGQ